MLKNEISNTMTGDELLEFKKLVNHFYPGTYETEEDNEKKANPEYRKTPKERGCHRCGSKDIPVSNGYSFSCRSCGLVHNDSIPFEYEVPSERYYSNTYKRIFYWNERFARWVCKEPRIEDSVFKIIEDHYARTSLSKKVRRRGYDITRRDVSRLLKSITLPEGFSERYRSKKFKKNPMTKKRFYNKYNERWKQIKYRLIKKEPLIPSVELEEQVKFMLKEFSQPFEYHKGKECHNFLNWDYTVLIILAILDKREKWKGVYKQWKNDFKLPSSKTIEMKLKPIMKKILKYHRLKYPKLK